MSSSHSAAGVIARLSPTALAMARYASSRTDSLSFRRAARLRPVVGVGVMDWAAARLSACCSRRSTLKSSWRMDSSLSHGAVWDARPKARRTADPSLALVPPPRPQVCEGGGLRLSRRRLRCDDDRRVGIRSAPEIGGGPLTARTRARRSGHRISLGRHSLGRHQRQHGAPHETGHGCAEPLFRLSA